MANNPNAARNLKPFLPGDDPRRRNGRPKGSQNVSTLLRHMLEEIAPDDVVNAGFIRQFCKRKKRVTNAEAMAARLLYCALVKRESWAIKELLDRTEGKAKQTIEMGGIPDSEPVTLVIQGVQSSMTRPADDAVNPAIDISASNGNGNGRNAK